MEICNFIEFYPEEIKTYVLKKYMTQIQKLTSITYYKERLAENSPYMIESQVKECIQAMEEWLVEQYFDTQKTMKISKENIRRAKIQLANRKKMGLINKINFEKKPG